MRIFLTHASEDRDSAEQIFLTLISAGHRVFFDGAAVQGGDDFNARIREHIEECELLVFLISPDSVAESSYALTELKFAKRKWPHPRGHVLPVVIRRTSDASIPEYLKAVSILRPEGNAAAEIGEEVRGWKKRHRGSFGVGSGLAILLSALLIISTGGFLVWYFSKPPSGRPASAYPSPKDARDGSVPSPAPTTNNPDLRPTPIPSASNKERVQTSPSNQVKPNANSIHDAPANPAPNPVVLSSMVFVGERAIKGARVSIVELPELGTMLTDDNGAFIFTKVPKKVNDAVTIRVQYAGFRTEEVAVKIGRRLPKFYLEEIK